MEINKKKRFRLPSRKEIAFLIMLLPALVITLVFAYLPMMGLFIAFKEYDPLIGIFGSPWAADYGFANFIEIFRTPGLVEAIWNTLYLNILSLALTFPTPIIFALLLDEVRNKAYKSVVQTVSYLPHFLSTIAVVGIVGSLFSQYGVINDVLKMLGLERIIFFAKSEWFIPIYLIINVWKGLGWNSIVYLSAIAGISTELYEAATIDGAGRFKQVWYITIPSLMPTAMILLILSLGGIFGSSFDLIYGLQNGVDWTMDVIATAVYKNGILEGQYGLSTALGLMQGGIALILTFGVNAISKKVSEISMW